MSESIEGAVAPKKRSLVVATGLSEEQHAQVSEIARTTERSRSAVLRRALREYYERWIAANRPEDG